ncbi:hypothetical protein E2L00_20270 [Cedecea colo]|uniref:DUF1010 domain-containing protein n=1 Tax=Cedecea colo TaxID=2552946 RepID=A0ABX0VRS4_9ENTR|nr:hypothetical protein [Cedecea colo]
MAGYVAFCGRCSFCAVSLPIARGVHNLFVPLSIRCIYSFVSPPCYLRGVPLTRLWSPKAVHFLKPGALVLPRSMRSQSSRRDPLLTISPCS